MSLAAAWFARVGGPLDEDDRADIAAIARAAGDASSEVERMISWFAACAWAETAAAVAIAEEDEDERERLWQQAAQLHTEGELLAQLQPVTRDAAASVRAAAQDAVARQRIHEPMLVDAATAAALLAIHHHALALLAGVPDAHPFMRRHALFRRGRWPLGCHAGRYVIY